MAAAHQFGDPATMSFSSLPREITHEIFVAAVNVRGLKRAIRLRYVSKSWNSAVVDAMFTSGILDTLKDSHWGRGGYQFRGYLAYRVLSRRRVSWPFAVLRRVAERLAEYRSGGMAVSEDALKACVSEICEPALMTSVFHSNLTSSWFDGTDDTIGAINEDDKSYQQALLAAAAWTNEVALARDVLPFIQDSIYLLWNHGRIYTNQYLKIKTETYAYNPSYNTHAY
jgi:hypothetical protein